MAEKVKQYRLPDDPITLDELKSFLWAAATHLRGQIDAAGYKEYIFPLLFFKRISDVYDEQFEGFVCEGGVEYAGMQVEDLPIRIPDGAHWRDVREVTENVGNKLVEAFIAIEQANPAKEMDGRKIGGLEGIFGPKDGWTNKAKMPDNIITSLIEDFSKYTLSLKACPADEMGQAYEYLVGKFADDAGNTAQEFYTNRTVVQLMAEILQPQPNESIYDPTCGSGGMLVKCLDYLRNKGAEWQSVQVFGQEVNGLTSSIARMNLYLNGVEDFSIACADTLEHPAFLDGSHLRKFDIVLANPPYSIKEWNREKFMNDKWGRNVYVRLSRKTFLPGLRRTRPLIPPCRIPLIRTGAQDPGSIGWGVPWNVPFHAEAFRKSSAYRRTASEAALRYNRLKENRKPCRLAAPVSGKTSFSPPAWRLFRAALPVPL